MRAVRLARGWWAGWSQRLEGEVLIVLLSRVVSAVAGLVFVVITARHLGPTGRGEIVLAFTIAWATVFIANLGTPISGRIRLLKPEDAVGPRDVLSLTLALVPLQALLVLAVVGLISLTSMNLTGGFSLAMGALALTTMLFHSAVYVLYGLRRYRVVLVAEVAIAIVEVTAVVVLLLGGWLTTISAVLTMAMGSALGGIWLIGRSKDLHEKVGHGLAAYWRALIVDGFYPMLGEIAMFIALRLDRVVLAVAVGADSLGLYAVALAIPETLRILPRAFGQVIADRGRSGLESVAAVRRRGRYFVVGHVLVLAAAVVIGWVVLPLVFGEGFREARDVLVFVAIAEALLSIHFMYQALLMGFGRFRGIGWPQIIGGIVMVILNVVLIPIWGIWGAVWACIIGYGALAAISASWAHRELQRLEP